MGMGFKSISDYNANPPFQSMIAAGVVDDDVFGFKFADSGSELYLGGVNDDLYTGSFTWVPVTDEVGLNHILRRVRWLITNNRVTGK